MARLIDADKLTYTDPKLITDPFVWAIRLKEIDKHTVKAIPIDWIIDWLTKQTIPATSYGIDCSAIHKMLDDWEKENELDKT